MIEDELIDLEEEHFHFLNGEGVPSLLGVCSNQINLGFLKCSGKDTTAPIAQDPPGAIPPVGLLLHGLRHEFDPRDGQQAPPDRRAGRRLGRRCVSVVQCSLHHGIVRGMG